MFATLCVCDTVCLPHSVFATLCVCDTVCLRHCVFATLCVCDTVCLRHCVFATLSVCDCTRSTNGISKGVKQALFEPVCIPKTAQYTDTCIECYRPWFKNSDEGKINLNIFLDLKKAFDTVDH